MEIGTRYWNFLVIILVISMVLPLSGCAQSSQLSKSQLPVWVNNPSDQFSESRYLMAVGSSDTRQGARNQAQANLAKIFVSRVDVNESYLEEFEETTSSETGTTTEDFTQLITESQIESNQQMKNVEIKEVHQAQSGTIYALAVMDRMETSQLYTEEINRNNENITSLRQKAEQTNSELERLIYMKQALTRARVNEMLINQRAILTGRTTQGEGATLAEITQEYRQAKQGCTVSIEGEDIPREIQSTLSRQLQNEGFTVVSGGKEPVVSINVNLMIAPVDLNRPNTEFVQWALQVEAQNKQNGRWFSTFTAEGREGSVNQQYARRRAIQAVRKKISTEFSDFIESELLSVQ